MKILVVGDPHGKLPKRIPKKVDLILVTGDLGKADLARRRAFENIERKKKGLPEVVETSDYLKKSCKEIYDSSMKILKYLSKSALTYTIMGNVWNSDEEIKKDGGKFGIKLPSLIKDLKKIKNIHVVKNSICNINGLRVGFLEYFNDICWSKEFNEKDKKEIKKAKKETSKAKKILKWFAKQKIDVLLCHQPPYGILDKVTAKYAPKHWRGKHAGSKVILDYVRKYQPKYVFCGHIHEGKGKKKIGKTTVINAGCCGDYFVFDI